MMMSEFIERTGFEPTGEEYRAIEDEYMGCNEDKDSFCKNWKKNGCVQRLMRTRARKIEQLESNVRVAERESAYMKGERNKFRAEFHEAERRISNLEAENESLKASLTTLAEADAQWKKIVQDLETQVAEYKKAEEQLKAVKNLIAVLSN